MKIKINREQSFSPTVDALLQFKRHPPHVKMRWIVLPIIILLLMYTWQQRFFTGWVIIPLIWTVVMINIGWTARSCGQKLQNIEALKINPLFWNRLQQQYPELGLKQQGLIEQGFKDYLALHAMQKQAYAMPSHAVDALWHVMLEFPAHYQQLCQQTLGRMLHHQPYDASVKPEVQLKQLLETWKYSCMLHQYPPRHTSQLARLFAIDQVLNWRDGQYFELKKMTRDYAQYLREQSSSSSCGGSSCGGD